MNLVNGVTPLQQLIRAHTNQIKYIQLKNKMPTTAAAAKAMQVSESSIIKTCIIELKKEKKFYAVILRDTDFIDDKKKAKELFGKFSFATSEKAAELTGYQAGGIPPIGLGEQIAKVYMDQRVFQEKMVYGGGGKQESLIHISPELIKTLNEAETVDIAKEVQSESESKEIESKK